MHAEREQEMANKRKRSRDGDVGARAVDAFVCTGRLTVLYVHLFLIY